MFMFLFVFFLSLQAFSMDCRSVTSLSEVNQITAEHLQSTMNSEGKKINFKEVSKWSEAKSKKKGYMLLVHGLNNNGELFNPMIDFLNQQGISVLNTVLIGQRGNFKEAQKVTIDDMLKQVKSHYCLVHQRAKKEGQPLYVLGYSLGGALLVNMLQSHPEIKPEISHMFLFSPAIELQLYAQATWLATILPRSWVLKSQARVAFRANEYTPVALYEVTWRAFNNAHESGVQNVSDVETTILMDPRDALVDYKAMLSWVKGAKKWSLLKLDAGSGEIYRESKHFTVHPKGLGKKEWPRIQQMLLKIIHS